MQNTSLKGHHLELSVQSPCQHHPVGDKREILLNEVVQGLYICSTLDDCLSPPPSSPVNLACTPALHPPHCAFHYIHYTQYTETFGFKGTFILVNESWN